MFELKFILNTNTACNMLQVFGIRNVILLRVYVTVKENSRKMSSMPKMS